jgi:hypothetical protein
MLKLISSFQQRYLYVTYGDEFYDSDTCCQHIHMYLSSLFLIASLYFYLQKSNIQKQYTK